MIVSSEHVIYTEYLSLILIQLDRNNWQFSGERFNIVFPQSSMNILSIALFSLDNTGEPND